jgi:hypothetical protein
MKTERGGWFKVKVHVLFYFMETTYDCCSQTNELRYSTLILDISSSFI